ncbi:hypothetical protein [Thiomonas sp. FB-6]|uniref:hypothetical protein n=1 Tax=Thiomonas sp. FB-6 TaxID=1158291 RepID=UPI0003A50B53|nr:hypothetical protein [Thiomonas sp. FB-6]
MVKNQHWAGRAVAAPPLRYVTRLLGVLAALWLCAATGSLANAGQPWPAPRPNRLPGAHGQPWLEGHAAEPACRDALTLARSVYFAAGPDLHPVSVNGKAHDFELIAYPATADSMSDIVADAQVFTPIASRSPSSDVPGQPASFFKNAGYRQTERNAGWRLALTFRNQSWKANNYFAVLQPQGTTLRAVLQSMYELPGFGAGFQRDATSTALVSYFPMTVLRDTASETLAIIRSDYSKSWSAWTIFRIAPSGFKQQCKVRFRPHVTADGDFTPYPADHLLPPPVRRLAALLDSTLGSGDQDGELQSTLHLRDDARAIWLAVALRPWAMQSTPYNSRDEVDAGLRLWSIQGKAYRQIYDAIQQDYPIARRALARYYERAFDLPSARAASLSDYTLDVAFRSSFVFHSDRGFGAESGGDNPWEISS